MWRSSPLIGGLDAGPVVVVEFCHAGHHLYYVKRLVSAMPEEKVCFLVTTAESALSEEFQTHLRDLERSGRLKVLIAGRADESTWRLMRRAEHLMDRSDLQSLIIPSADKLLVPALAFLLRERIRGRSTPTRMLLLRTPEIEFRFQRSVLVALLKSILALLVPICGRHARCFFLTDAFGVVTSRRGYGRTQPVRDLSPGLSFTSRAMARHQLGISSRSFVIGIFGDLSRRKFPELSIKALESLPQCVELVAAGRMDVETGKAIRSHQAAGGTRIHSLDGYVSDDTLATHISSCDAIVLTYESDAPSGMLVSAVEAGIPVIAAGSPWLTRIVREGRLGLVTDLSAVGLASAVKLLMTEASHALPLRLPPSEVPSLVQALVGRR